MTFSKKTIGALVGGVLLATGAQAADGVSGAMKNLDPEAWHKQMCTDRYADSAGRMAYIEAKLSLTDSQRPLFDSWKQTVLGSAKAQENECLARRSQMAHHNILERQAHMMQRLQHRMADMTAERPSLQALYNALSPEQKKAFERPNQMGAGEHGPHGNWHDHGPDGPGERG